MACTTAESVDEQKKLLTMSIRNEIVWDLVTQMFAFKAKLDRVFCGTVAKELVKKYPFMKDSGMTTSDYVSLANITFSCFVIYKEFLFNLKGSWEKKLIECVHNVRSSSGRKRSLPEDLPASQCKRGRPKASSHSRYPVLGIPENDEACDGRNVKELEKELQ